LEELFVNPLIHPELELRVTLPKIHFNGFNGLLSGGGSMQELVVPGS